MSILRLLFLPFSKTALISVMPGFFYSGGTLAWVCPRLCLLHCGSQCLSVAHQGFPNRSALIRALTM